MLGLNSLLLTKRVNYSEVNMTEVNLIKVDRNASEAAQPARKNEKNETKLVERERERERGREGERERENEVSQGERRECLSRCRIPRAGMLEG